MDNGDNMGGVERGKGAVTAVISFLADGHRWAVEVQIGDQRVQSAWCSGCASTCLAAVIEGIEGPVAVYNAPYDPYGYEWSSSLGWVPCGAMDGVTEQGFARNA